MFRKIFTKRKTSSSESDSSSNKTDVDMAIDPSNYSNNSNSHTDGSAQGSPLKITPQDTSKYNINILIVDDAKINRYVLKRYLMRLKKNISITEADNGLDALKKVAENTYDVIFIDLKMPVMDGITATKEILKKHNMPIFGVTGQVETESVSLCLQIGMKNILAKPVSIGELNSIFIRYFPNLE